MKRTEHKPSQWALIIFQWFCHPDYREEIEGDLIERFNVNVLKDGINKANRHFVKDVIQLMRPSLIGDLNQLTHTQTMVISKQNKRLVTILSIATALLVVPLIAMLFTSEVNWKIFDFIVAGILLVGTGLTLEFILRKVTSKKYRLLLAIALFVLLLMVWAELAVGIFGTPIAGS